MEIKKSRTGLHLIVGVLLGIIICVGVIFATYELGYLTFDTKEENETVVSDDDEDSKNAEEVTIDNIYGFGSGKVTNANGITYTLTTPTHATGINLNLDTTGTKVTLSINPTLVNEAYSLGWVTAAESYIYEPYEITFDQKVIDIFFGGIGQDVVGDTILFLMEDKTIEYIPVKTALMAGTDNLKSYGTISGISDVVKFYEANAKASTSGFQTILVETKDGTLYDLRPIINNGQ